MISMYFTDIINIITVITNNLGVKTETTGTDIKCRIEDYNKLIVDDKGQKVMAEIKCLLPYYTNIKYGDKIKIKKKNGITYNQPDKKFLVKKSFMVAMFDAQYLQVVS